MTDQLLQETGLFEWISESGAVACYHATPHEYLCDFCGARACPWNDGLDCTCADRA